MDALLEGRLETTVSFLIRKRDGFTRRLLDAVEKNPDGRERMVALVEGPYGLSLSLSLPVLDIVALIKKKVNTYLF